MSIQQTCRCPSSAVPKPTFATNYSFFSIFRNVEELHAFAQLVSTFCTVFHPDIPGGFFSVFPIEIQVWTGPNRQFTDVLQYFARFRRISFFKCCWIFSKTEYISPRVSQNFIRFAGNSGQIPDNCRRSVFCFLHEDEISPKKQKSGIS